ncbi:unnamed protein product [Periconia digitata]|uniref:Uncharacterized protein n=1 Tax=Periconia digitata TaxID=1303443 RepID=A0A9W4UKE8_9PLEO|nr:unnamed protein product [Periconia digitata]
MAAGLTGRLARWQWSDSSKTCAFSWVGLWWRMLGFVLIADRMRSIDSSVAALFAGP